MGDLPDTVTVNGMAETALPNGKVRPPFPWFGMDIGGTLTKLVYFEPTDVTQDENQAETADLKTIKHYLLSATAYGKTGLRDSHLEMRKQHLGGREGNLHFIRFPTYQMPTFIEMAKTKNFKSFAQVICATGGGAYKFAKDFKQQVDLKLLKFDELECLARGIQYIERFNPAQECFFFEKIDPKEFSKAQKIYHDFRDPHPFILVNIGSGVSILSVRLPNDFRRVSGSSIGGGTFVGLCCLLANVESYEQAIELAMKGDHLKVDKLVRDIYGGDYGRFGLSGDVIAASFGNMLDAEKRQSATPADLCSSALMAVTFNIASLATLCAKQENAKQIVYVGNFLRVNDISIKLLSYATDFWTQGQTKALFLEHTGYFGAMGCVLNLINTGIRALRFSTSTSGSESGGE